MPFKSRSTPPSSSRLTTRSLNYRFMQPRALPDRGTAPLLLFLHGAGERGEDNVRQLQNLPETLARFDSRRQRPCFVLVPQCPSNSDWSNWMPELEQLILATIDEHEVDPRRVYLTGYSMGGFGSWELASRRPDLFAAVIPICGGGEKKIADRLAAVSIWTVHGAGDAAVPVERSREMIEAIREAGGDPKYSELAGVGHDSWSQTYDPASEILDWMFDQVRTDAPLTEDAQ